jgi:hypothetical protein
MLRSVRRSRLQRQSLAGRRTGRRSSLPEPPHGRGQIGLPQSHLAPMMQLDRPSRALVATRPATHFDLEIRRGRRQAAEQLAGREALLPRPAQKGVSSCRPRLGEAAHTRPGSSRQLCGQASVRPYLGLFSATLTMRSLREAAEDAQPLPGTSAGTRGRWSQPRACHENLGGGFRSRTAILDATQLHPGVQICHGGPAEAPRFGHLGQCSPSAVCRRLGPVKRVVL